VNESFAVHTFSPVVDLPAGRRSRERATDDEIRVAMGDRVDALEHAASES